MLFSQNGPVSTLAPLQKDDIAHGGFRTNPSISDLTALTAFRLSPLNMTASVTSYLHISVEQLKKFVVRFFKFVASMTPGLRKTRTLRAKECKMIVLAFPKHHDSGMHSGHTTKAS